MLNGYKMSSVVYLGNELSSTKHDFRYLTHCKPRSPKSRLYTRSSNISTHFSTHVSCSARLAHRDRIGLKASVEQRYLVVTRTDGAPDLSLESRITTNYYFLACRHVQTFVVLLPATAIFPASTNHSFSIVQSRSADTQP